ncbi:hypothetical protein [Pseudobutyrivibrio xylanivorans]|uniref:hypothetical protein n=1 Tax=Pseudobutyrivibrio xylanivorans TaxID=185007 RepID=UPI00124C4F22|nr:hypothetical protein [Pseudobutyrivibrio xylanivorans]
MKKKGFKIELHSSRDKTCENSAQILLAVSNNVELEFDSSHSIRNYSEEITHMYSNVYVIRNWKIVTISASLLREPLGKKAKTFLALLILALSI